MMYVMNGKVINSSSILSDVKQITSVHGLIRTMERTGMNERQALRCIHNARLRGKTTEQMDHQWQKQFLSFRSNLQSDAQTSLRVYSGFLFIFNADGILITMYPLPRSFTHKRIFDGKTRVRDVRKYSRLNSALTLTAETEELELLCG